LDLARHGPQRGLPYVTGSLSIPRANFRSFLDEFLESTERIVPTPGNRLEALTSFLKPPCFELPDTLPTAPNVPDQAGFSEHMKMFRNGLASDGGARGETCDGHGTAGAEPGYQREPGFVAESCEDGRSDFQLCHCG